MILNYQDSVGGVTDVVIAYPDSTSTIYKKQWLSDHNIRINAQFLGGSFNPFAVYYNQTYAQDLINKTINRWEGIIWKDYAEVIILGDEVPATLLGWKNLSGDHEHLKNYNNTFYNETGLFLRESYSNLTEYWIFHQWAVKRLSDGLNVIYDALKNEYPSTTIGWATIPWDGFQPSLIKSDFIIGGYYTSDFRDFYAKIRHAKLTAPNKPILSVIDGVSDPLDNFYFPLEKQQQFFWTSYFAGSSITSFFGAGNYQNWTDYGDIKLFNAYNFHSSLQQAANILPVLNITSKVLYVGTLEGADVKPAFGIRDFDSTTEFQVIKNSFNLQSYNLIIIENRYNYMDKFVAKVVDYVHNGGNVVFKGNNGFGYSQILNAPALNASGNNRSVIFPFESGMLQNTYIDRSSFQINNTLLNTQIPQLFSSKRNSINITLSSDWEIIETGLPEETNGFWPLSLYKNKTESKSGFYFFYGFDNELDSQLYHQLLNRFLQLRLGISDLMTPSDNINLLVPIGMDDANRSIIGIISDEYGDIANIHVNASNRELPINNTWIYTGFNEQKWIGTNNGYEYIINTKIDPYSAQRYVVASDFTKPDIKVYLQYPEIDPIPNENIPITLTIQQVLEHAIADDVFIKLKLPEGVFFSKNVVEEQSPFGDPIFRGDLESFVEYQFNWLIKSPYTGIFNIDIELSYNSNQTKKFYSFPLRIYPGRVDLLVNSVQFVLNEPYLIKGELKYRGMKNETFNIGSQIVEWDWGNVGIGISDVKLNSGESYDFLLDYSPRPDPIMRPILNDDNSMNIFVQNSDKSIFSEEYVYMQIVSSTIGVKGVILEHNNLIIDFETVGNSYVYNSKIQLKSPNIKNFTNEMYLGSIEQNSEFSITTEIAESTTFFNADLEITYNTNQRKIYNIYANAECFIKDLNSNPTESVSISVYTTSVSDDWFPFFTGSISGSGITLITGVLIFEAYHLNKKRKMN